MERIRTFISHRPQSALTDRIVQDYIVLVCDYCLLFYQRQFQTSSAQQSDLLAGFQKVLTDYYDRQLQHRHGLPSVKHCASELCLSPSYFGDVVRNATGDSPTRIIQRFLINRAKSLMVGGMTVSQVAEELGFEYPQHFTRYFKKHEGMTPSRYVALMRKQ